MLLPDALLGDGGETHGLPRPELHDADTALGRVAAGREGGREGGRGECERMRFCLFRKEGGRDCAYPSLSFSASDVKCAGSTHTCCSSSSVTDKSALVTFTGKPLAPPSIPPSPKPSIRASCCFLVW